MRWSVSGGGAHGWGMQALWAGWEARNAMTVRFLPAGDRGLVVEFGNEVSLAMNARVRALDAGLAAMGIPGLIEAVPTYRSLGIEYDPFAISFEALRERVGQVLADLDPSVLPPPKRVRLPTVYGGEYG